MEQVLGSKDCPDGLLGLNLHRSTEFVTNSRGQKLHIRTHACANVKKCKGLVISLHGIGAHISRINQAHWAKSMTETNNYHYVCLDFHGHGHSEGDRAMINNYRDLLDDITSLLNALYRIPSDEVQTHCNISLPPLRAASCPFYVMGNSLGGAVSLLFTHLATSPTTPAEAQGWTGACKGAILASPALSIKKPADIIINILDYVIVPLFPTSHVPHIFTSLKSDDLIWDRPEYIDYVTADGYPVGLSNREPITFKSAQSVLRMSDAINELLPRMGNDMRVLVLMDPNDQVCQFSGVEKLQELSPLNERGLIKVVPMVDGRHDVLTNQMDRAMEIIGQWLS